MPRHSRMDWQICGTSGTDSLAMHSYEIEGRKGVFIILATPSFLLVWLVDFTSKAVGIDPPWWITTPSFAGFYSVLHMLFDRYIWRSKILHRVGLIKVPNLNGKWKGAIRSSYSHNGSERPVSVVITQRWSKILIRLDSADSHSYSESATLRSADPDAPELAYLYLNEPKTGAVDSMAMHRGTAIMRLRESALAGNYYTDRGRREIGTIRLTRRE